MLHGNEVQCNGVSMVTLNPLPRGPSSGWLVDREFSIWRILAGEINLGRQPSTEFGFAALMGTFNGSNNRYDRITIVKLQSKEKRWKIGSNGSHRKTWNIFDI